MAQSDQAPGRYLRGGTTPSSKRPAPKWIERTRCQKSFPLEGDSHFEDEIGAVLGCRLGLAALLILITGFIFLLKNLLVRNQLVFPTTFDLLVLALIPCVAGLVVVLLKLRKSWTCNCLRGLEWVLFGSMTAFFAWLHIRHILSPEIREAIHLQENVVGLVVVGMMVKWVLLILIYGVFIPNSWARCARMTIGCALVPLSMTGYLAWVQGEPNFLLGSVFPSTMMLGLAVAIAVFGSYRIQLLQRQALEAQELGQYRLQEMIGKGGMGEVYRAQHRLLCRPCAIKLLRREYSEDGVILERFEREVQSMARLTHPNTVMIFDYGKEEDGTFYYVMEYLEGKNLEELVQQHGPVDHGRAVHLLRQVCGALSEAHSMQMLHRDIKPSNVFVCRRGGVEDVAKLLDFGLVRHERFHNDETRLTTSGMVVGSPPYISPEQAAGKEYLDHRCDIYSLGAVAYFLLTGQPPFVRETSMQLLLAHAYEPVTPLRNIRPDIPVDLQEVVLRCLAKKPSDRFPDARTLEKTLARCVCANDWDQQKAANWWEVNMTKVDTTIHPVPEQPTPT